MPSYPIVGSHYRQPAPVILEALGLFHPLLLRAEPSNQYDINAIQVLLQTETLLPDIKAQEYLKDQLSACGLELSDIFAQDEWHLGYIPKDIAKILRDENVVPIDEDINVIFSTNHNGRPFVLLGDS